MNTSPFHSQRHFRLSTNSYSYHSHRVLVVREYSRTKPQALREAVTREVRSLLLRQDQKILVILGYNCMNLVISIKAEI